MKLALGTVQFGLDYGVANDSGQVSEHSVKEILSLAEELGIKTLDTAAAYGNSEQVLGQNKITDFEVVSKIPPGLDYSFKPDKLITESTVRSLDKLGISSLHGLLLHRPMDLLQKKGELIYKALQELRQQGLVNKIGVSIYGPDDLEKLSKYDFDIIQAPMNIFDRRLKGSGWLKKLKEKKTEIHIRSVFLQGLLLMPPLQRPAYFKRWSDLLERYDTWIKEQELTPLRATLGYLKDQPEIDKIIVGVNNSEQLREIVSAICTLKPMIPADIQSDDLDLINPARWKL